jgi:drug/metabolite transporter (DMT)-like permease
MTTLTTESGTARRKQWLGYLAALGAAASYGTVAVIGRMVVQDLAPPLVLTSFSMMFGTILLFVLFQGQARKDISKPKPRRAWLFAALAGCASSWGITFFFLALNQAPVVLVAPLAGTSPLISIALSHFFLHRLEKVTWRTIVGALMVFAGVVLITFGSL